MLTDIALPYENEEEFIRIASSLGYKRLLFLYDISDFNSNLQKRLNEIKTKSDVRIETGMISGQKYLSKAAGISKFIAAKSSDKDRFMIESKKIRMIYGFEEIPRKDFMHQRASGLNHVMCELANKNNIVFGFSYSSLLGKSTQDASLLIGRTIQNIKMCQKYKVMTAIGSFSSNPYDLRAPNDLASLFSLLGMDGKRIKESMSITI